MATITKAKCPTCGWEWVPRVQYPKQCPNPKCPQFWPLGEPKPEQR